MKTRIFTLLIILYYVSNTMLAQSPLSQNTPFKDWYKNTAVETTYVTKSMWSMFPNMKIGNKDIADLKNVVEQIEIYTSPNKSQGWAFGTLMRNAIDASEKNNYELIMQLSNDSKQVIYYAKKDDNDKNSFRDLILINTETTSIIEGKCKVIRLLGKFSISDIRDLMSTPESKK